MRELREWGFLIFHTLELRGSTSRMACCSVSNSVSVATKPTPAGTQANVSHSPKYCPSLTISNQRRLILLQLKASNPRAPSCQPLTIGIVWAQGH